MALLYSPETTLLVVGSNASCGCAGKEAGKRRFQWNFDHDAEKIYDTFTDGGRFIDKSRAQLILSSSRDCAKEGMLEAIVSQVKRCSVNQDRGSMEDESLFTFVYTGRSCDTWCHGHGFEFTLEGDFTVVSPDPSSKRYSLVLNNYYPITPETHLSGDAIGCALRKGGKPGQVLIILECPFAENIARDLKKSLSDCRYFEIVVTLRNNRVPCYYHTLECSTFSFFFNLALKKIQFTKGLFPLMKVLISVKRCCEALSSLDLVQDGDWITKNAIIPEAQFVQIPFRAQRELERIQNVNLGDLSYDEVDADFRFQPLIERFYKWNGKRNVAKICKEAVDWSCAATEVYLKILKSEDVLQGSVLEATVGSMVHSIATIQVRKEKEETCTNFFVQAFMLAVAAVDFVDHDNEELGKDSLIVSSSVYYQKAVESCRNMEMSTLVEALIGN